MQLTKRESYVAMENLKKISLCDRLSNSLGLVKCSRTGTTSGTSESSCSPGCRQVLLYAGCIGFWFRYTNTRPQVDICVVMSSMSTAKCARLWHLANLVPNVSSTSFRLSLFICFAIPVLLRGRGGGRAADVGGAAEVRARGQLFSV